MLALNNVTKIFGNSKAVDNVSLSVDRPMMIGIIGASLKRADTVVVNCPAPTCVASVISDAMSMIRIRLFLRR